MAYLQVGEYGIVNATNVNVRESPVTGKVMYRAQRNDRVLCTGIASGSDGYTWLRIVNRTQYSYSEGFIRHDFVDKETGSGGGLGGNLDPGTYAYIAGTGVNVRELPGGAYSYVCIQYAQVYLLGRILHTDGYYWYYVRNLTQPEKPDGYIRGDLLTEQNENLAGKRMFMVNASSVNVRSAASGSTLGRYPQGRWFVGVYSGDGSKVYTVWPSSNTQATVDASFLTPCGYAPGTTAAIITVAQNATSHTRANFGPAEGDWCKTFVNWCAVMGGAAWHSTYGISGCSSSLPNLNYRLASSGYQPRAGDWVFYKKDGSTAQVDHVGLVTQDSYGGYMWTIEANRGDADSVRQFNLPIIGKPTTFNSDLTPYAYAIPPYK